MENLKGIFIVISLICITTIFYISNNYENRMDFHKNLVESYKKTNGYNQLVYSLKEEVKKLKAELKESKGSFSKLRGELDQCLLNKNEKETESTNNAKLLKDLKNQVDLYEQRVNEDSSNEQNAKQEILNLQRKNEDLKSQVEQHKPSYREENLKRKIYNHFIEISNLIVSKQHKTLDDGFMTLFNEQIIAAKIDVENLQEVNADWINKESKSLSNLVQKRLEYLQNPSDCTHAKRLVCQTNQGCGSGCQIHWLLYCFMIAYKTQRTLVVDPSILSRYSDQGWSSVFQNVSGNCTHVRGAKPQLWTGEDTDSEVLIVNLMNGNFPKRPRNLLLSVPEDLHATISTLNGSPPLWWVGQLLTYLWKPQPWLLEDMEKFKEALNRPIVGVQIRRTDKLGIDARRYEIEEYMTPVENWYKKYETKLKYSGNKTSNYKLVKRVYLATDDPTVLPEARKKYPDYVFYGDTSISQSAQMRTRYTQTSLSGVVTDVHMLSNCDYLVCTLSSNICRMTYELMQGKHPDATNLIHSLDDNYFYIVLHAYSMIGEIAIHDHQPSGPNQIELRVGDQIVIRGAGDYKDADIFKGPNKRTGNLWNGWSVGVNRRTRKAGWYPTFKTVSNFRTMKFPKYPDF